MRRGVGMLAAVAMVLGVAGCGALFNSGPAKVSFTSSPEGAEIWIDGVRRGTTPAVIELPKNKDYVVVFRKEGHEEVTASITKRVGATYVVLDVLVGLLPVVIDAATGSWYVLSSDAVHGTLGQANGEELSGTLTPSQLEEVLRGVPASRFIELPGEGH